MKRCISVILAVVFMITMLPANAIVQPQSESPLSQIQSFNDENGISQVTENVTEAPAADEIANEEISVKTEEFAPVKLENISEIRNVEEEIIETVPVSEEEEKKDEENPLANEKSERETRRKATEARILREIEEFGSLYGDYDWYAEAFEEPAEVIEESVEVTEEPAEVIEEPIEVTEEAFVEETEEYQETEEVLPDEDSSVYFEEEADEEPVSDAENVIEEELSSDAVLADEAEVEMTESSVSTGVASGSSGSSAAPVRRTVSGTVTLPASAVIAAGSNMNIYAYKAPVLEGSRIIKEPEVCWRRYVNLEAGQRVVTFSETLLSGEYIFGVEFLTGNKSIVNRMYYYTEDGLVLDAHVADIVSVNSNVSNINMEIPAAEGYISGYITFLDGTPTATNNWLYIEAYSEGIEKYYEAQIRVPAYAKGTSYEIGLPAGAYDLWFYGNTIKSGGYASGTISNKNHSSIITVDGAVTNLDATAPIRKVSSGSGATGDTYTVTVNFDNAASENEEYIVALIIDDEEYPYIYTSEVGYVEEGENSFTVELYMDSEEEGPLYVAYRKMGQYWSDMLDATYKYYNNDLGIVSNIKEATAVNGEFDITINEPATALIYGDIINDTGYALTGEAYVGAEIDGELYYDIVDLVYDDSYTIYVPEKLVGNKFEMFFARDSYGNVEDEHKVYCDDTYVLEESQSIDVGVGKYDVLSGTIYLPMGAPESGANVQLEMRSFRETYVIEPGEESIEYVFPKPSYFTGYNMWAYLKTVEPFDSVTSVMPASFKDIYFNETVTFSGEIKLPEDMKLDNDVSMRVGLSGKENSWTSCSILKGENSTTYSVKYPKGAYVDEIRVRINENDAPVSDYYEVYDAPADNDAIFDIQLGTAKTISGNITLPESVEYDGEEFEYEVFAIGSDGLWYEAYYETANPEGDNNFSVKVSPDEDVTYRVGVMVYNFPDSDDTCIETDSHSYYVSDYAMTMYEAEAATLSADSVVNMYFPMKKTVSGKILFTDDAFTTGELMANIHIQDQWQSSYINKNYEITSLDDGVEYSAYVPRKWDYIILEINLWENNENGTTAGGSDEEFDPVKTNVSLGNYKYDKTEGFVPHNGTAPAMIEVNSDLVIPDFTVPKAYKLTGKVLFPSDFKSTEALEYIDLYFEPTDPSTYGHGEVAFLDRNNNFEAYVPYYVDGMYYIAAYKPWQIGTNILGGQHYHADNAGNPIPVKFTSGRDMSGIQIAYETGYAVSGTISLPQDAVISENGVVDVNVRCGDNSGHVSLNSTTRSATYMFGVPKGNAEEMPIQVGVYTYSREQDELPGNIYTGEFFLSSTGELEEEPVDIDTFVINSDTTKNITLLTGVPVTINIERPANNYGHISGYVNLDYACETEDDWYSKSEYFSIYVDEDSTSMSLVIPKDYSGKEFYVSYYANSGDVYTGGNVWVNPDGSYSKTLAGAETYTIQDGTEIDFTLGTREQLAKTITGTISFEEGCVLPNGSYYLYVYAYNPSYGVYADDTLYLSTASDTEYELILPDYAGDWRVYTQIYSNNTNVCSNTLYYTSTGVTLNQNEATLVPADSTDINIEIPKLSKVSGKIVVDEDYKYVDELQRVNITFRRQSDYGTRGVTAQVDEDMNYYAYLPYDFAGDCQVGVRITSDGGMNNLVKNYTYWSDEVYTIEHGEDAENVDVSVETGYTVSGKLKLPEGVEVTGGGYIYYALRLDNDYANLYFYEGDTEADFMFGMSKNNSYYSRIFRGNGGYTGNEVLNVYLNDVEYTDDGSVYYNWENPPYFYISEDMEDIEIVIPEGIVVDLEISGPTQSHLYGDFVIREISDLFSESISFNYSQSTKNASIVLPKESIGSVFTVGYECNSTNLNNQYYIPWEVYLNNDGKFYGDREEGSAYVLAEENNFKVTLPLAKDVVYPEAILQSEHPYGNNIDEVYNYTYKGENGEVADSLMVTFSQNTELDYSDRIYITDGNGAETSYSSYELSGATITIPGASFTLRLTSDSYGTRFGFAITDVRPVVTHTVTFQNYDGEVLETVTVLDGQSAEYTGLTPTKPEDGDKKYRFIGWDKDPYNVTEDMIVTAVFEEVIIYLESEHPYGTGIDETYSYEYPGEADALRITFSDKTETENRYDNIYIFHADGTQQGKYSGTSLAGKSVTVKGNKFTIRLTSDSSVTKYGFEVTGIAPVKENYTVTFKNYDGTELSTVTVPAGTSAVYNGTTPVKEENGKIYRFIGWDKSLTAVYEDLVVTAQFRLIEYVTVRFYNYDGTLLSESTVIKGEVPNYYGSVPYRPIDDNGVGYVFTGWDREFYEVYTDTSYNARFARNTVKKISTEAELRAIENNLDGVYVLENDIELTSVWEPIGVDEPFSGVLDGNGYSIKNVSYDVSSRENVAFFSWLDNAVVRNLNLEVNVENSAYVYNSYVSGLAQEIHYSDVRNVHVKGIIDYLGYDIYVTGFADSAMGSYIDNSSANVDLKTNGSAVGFIGTVYDSTISNSYYSGTISAGNYIGDVIGFAEVGYEEKATVFDTCYSNAALDLSNNSDINRAVPFAGIDDEETATALNCYYNEDKFTMNSATEDEISLGTPLSDEEMKSQESFAGFDFDMTWEMGEDGYPVLSAAGGKICSEHKFTEWEKISDATCTEIGISTRTCTKCGRVERNVTPELGHSFSEWVETKEASVLSEGEMTRECSVCHEVEVQTTEKIAVDINDPNYGLVNFNIVDAVTLQPIENAQLFVSTDNDGENTFYTDENGRLSQVLPIGVVNISVYKSNYLTRTVKINVVQGEQDVPTIGISTKPLVEASLSSKVMTYDEIIAAGIDVNAPGNNHVVKYNITLTFGTERADVVTYFNEYHSCVHNTRIPVHLSTGTVYVYPVSENFYLMVYGEVQWLKELFDVEMLIMNNSNTDIVTECTAELTLPEGLSLAEMKEEQQTLIQNVEDIGHSESRSVHWYVRGDVAGEYNIGANLKAVLSPLGDTIDQNYTLEEPIKVYAGNAMHMDIYVPDMTFYGDDYPIRIELTNVSDRTLYNVSNSIKYFKEGKVTHYSNGAFVSETYFTEDNIASIGASEFKPGDKISIEVVADIEFRTSLIRTGLAEIKNYVENIDVLLNAYNAYITGAKVVNESYFELLDIQDEITNIITAKAYEGNDAEVAEELLAAVAEFTEILRDAESQQAVELFNKLKTTGVYKVLANICEKDDIFASYRANRITKYINTITAIIKSEEIIPAEAVTEEMLFELLRRAIESIPVKYYLENVLVSTLEGSTTSIPYTIHIVSTEERFMSIERLDGYLNSVVETAMGHIDSPWIMNILSGGSKTHDSAEDVIFVNGVETKFAASDNKGDVSFKAWTSATSSALDITCTNENAVFENGVLSFVGPGYISVKATEAGSGILYIQMGAETREYHYTVVDAHTCEASTPVTIVAPDAGRDGYMISLCDICHSIMSVDKHDDACADHAYGEYVVELDANGDELGIKHRTCTECGHIQYLVIDTSIDYMEFILTPESRLDMVEKDTGDGSYLKNVVAGNTADQIKSNFDNTNIEVVLADGSAVTATSKIGTGSKLVINSEDGTTSSELTVVVKGDTNGDGSFNILDMIKVFNHVGGDETKQLAGDYAEAAKVNTDKNINILDLILMFKSLQNNEVLR